MAYLNWFSYICGAILIYFLDLFFYGVTTYFLKNPTFSFLKKRNLKIKFLNSQGTTNFFNVKN